MSHFLMNLRKKLTKTNADYKCHETINFRYNEVSKAESIPGTGVSQWRKLVVDCQAVASVPIGHRDNETGALSIYGNPMDINET